MERQKGLERIEREVRRKNEGRQGGRSGRGGSGRERGAVGGELQTEGRQGGGVRGKSGGG